MIASQPEVARRGSIERAAAGFAGSLARAATSLPAAGGGAFGAFLRPPAYLADRKRALGAFLRPPAYLADRAGPLAGTVHTFRPTGRAGGLRLRRVKQRR